MARSLAAAKVRQAIKLANNEELVPSALPPGHMKLYDNFVPGLPTGLYGIEAKQTVTATDPQGKTSKITVFNYDPSKASVTDKYNPNAPTILQKFEVKSPQFRIDPKVVNSVYPPPGFSDEGRVLPHIVLKDPLLPWERYLDFGDSSIRQNNNLSEGFEIVTTDPSVINGFSTRTNGSSHFQSMNVQRYPYPWLALMVFDAEELALTPDEEALLKIPKSTSGGAPKQVGSSGVQVSSPGSYSMSVGDYMSTITSRMYYEKVYEPAEVAELEASEELTSIIFPDGGLVNDLFMHPSQFEYLAHVREINTVGFPDAGVEENGQYSVCISRRTGPLASPVPKTQVVHLVSLEAIAQTPLVNALGTSFGRVGMVSLYSWTYLSVPPNAMNVRDIMQNLGDTMQMLRPQPSILNQILNAATNQPSTDISIAAENFHERLSLGYNICRWRTAVGEESVAFSRGPLTPVQIPWVPSITPDWPSSSNSGKDYQILDKTLGVMDVSYSSAWQLGKLMAISDNVFNSALMRFRALVHSKAASATKSQVNHLAKKEDIVSDMGEAIMGLRKATHGSYVARRIVLPSSDKVAPPLDEPKIRNVYKHNITKIANVLSLSGEDIYTDYQLGKANNSDWEIIHKWISDKLYLGGIPASYIITDPALLPSEALRFFYVDDTWLDCFIDGALSVANHLEPIEDITRKEIKEAYNVYLRNTIDPAPIKPPIPRYGFILRSSLVKATPDLRLTVTCRSSTTPTMPDSTRDPLIRLTRMDDSTIFALLDCLPQEIFSIHMAQPPHQQRYVAGNHLDSTPQWDLRQLYTNNAPVTLWPPLDPSVTGSKQPSWYNIRTRCIEVVEFAQTVADALQSNNFDGYADAAMVALELNDPSYQILIHPPPGSTLPTQPAKDRQLWVGNNVAQVVKHVSLAHEERRSITTHDAPKASSALTRAPKINLSSLPVRLRVSNDFAPAASPTARPLYTLSVHPNYRGAAPAAFTAPDGSKTFSSKDYIPTSTRYLLNLIFSIRRDPTSTAPSPLVSISVSIPFSYLASAGHAEPLLKGDLTDFGGSMLYNRRFIVFLSISNSDTLNVKLVPRRTAAAGSAATLQGSAAADASFKLENCAIAPTVKPIPVKIVGKAAPENRGVCVISMVETYLLPNGTTSDAVSAWDVIKQDGGDKDPSGKDM